MILVVDKIQILKKNEGIQLPDFVVITGANGSGKSKLISELALGNPCYLTDDDGNRYIRRNVFNVSPDVESRLQVMPHDGEVSIYERQLALLKYYIRERESETDILSRDFIYEAFNRLENVFLDGGGVSLPSINEAFIENINYIIKTSKKRPQDISVHDFFVYKKIEYTGLLQSNLNDLFKQYIYKYNFYKELIGNESPPWVVFNNLLAESGLNYKVSMRDLDRGVTNLDLDIHLIKNAERIEFTDLSSGEKVIMSLIFAMYNFASETPENPYPESILPEYILFDEPDATLHPSMVKYFLNVLEKYFLGKKEIKLIMTTHSPTTVALAPDDSIFLMDDGVLKKSDKAIAIKSLTVGLKNLSIYYNHRKDVFVESGTDKYFFERIYEKLKDLRLENDISLHFISSGDKGSGWVNVNRLVKDLTNSGNKSTCGIIDWDNKHNESDRVKLLGGGKRHCIENYILDPLLWGLFIIQDNHPNFNEYYGLNKVDDHTNYLDFDSEKLQNIVNAVIGKLENAIGKIEQVVNIESKEKSIPLEKLDEQNLKQISVELINGNIITLPQWFMLSKKEDLEEIYFTAYSNVWKKHNANGNIKNTLITKTLSIYIKLLPIDILETFKRVQEIPYN
ncbi:hypothetical protein GCM10023149_52860 [Mucilaginibacter gynuensis]|uniref:ATPase AAA-type core domain-containing protein n=1 Tax=Mucilaginibacter gynuensis TaxID=1302236 RepID=A0ABP8HLQ3_9SPHI